MKNFILRASIGVAVLAVILAKLGPGGLIDALSQTDPKIALIVALIDLPILLLVSLRSRVVLARLGHDRVPAGVLFAAVTIGFVAGSLTPAASGELLRIEALRAHAGIEARDGLASVAFERVVSFYLFVLTGVAAGAIVLLSSDWAIAVIITVAVLAMLPAFASPLLRRLPRAASEPQRPPAKAYAYLRDTAGRIERLTDDRGLVLGWSVLTLAALALIALQFCLLGRSTGGGVSFQVAWLAMTGSQVLGIVSLLPFGIGISDTSLAAILARGGLSWQQGGAVALLVRLTITLPLIVIAVAAYVYLLLRNASRRPANLRTEEALS